MTCMMMVLVGVKYADTVHRLASHTVVVGSRQSLNGAPAAGYVWAWAMITTV